MTTSIQPDPEPIELCVLDRGKDEQLRVSLDTFKGHKFINTQVWFRGRDGHWHPNRAKRITIRAREITSIIEVLVDNAEKLLG